MGYGILQVKDLFIAPLYCGFLMVLCYIISGINYNNTERKIFNTSIIIRFFTTIAFSVIHNWVYGGDTSNYTKNGSRHLFNAFLSNPETYFKIVFQDITDSQTLEITNQMHLWANSNGTSEFVIKLVSIISIISFDSYIVMAFYISIFSFSGSWLIYKLFSTYYPNIKKILAYGILFTPSVLFWSSGVLKDSLTFGALGWLLYMSHNIFVLRKNIFTSVILSIISIYFLFKIKIYILLCFIPAFFIWLFFKYINLIKSKLSKIFMIPIFFIFLGITGYISLNKVSENNARYNVETIASTAKRSNEYLTDRSKKKGGAYYEIGTMDGSIIGYIKVIPKAIGIALFGPFIWEIRNIFMLMSGLESLVLLFITVKIFTSSKRAKVLSFIKNNGPIIFCLVFSIIFSLAIGIATANYGSLVRYKIPLIPFYWTLIVVIREFQKGNLKIA